MEIKKYTSKWALNQSAIKMGILIVYINHNELLLYIKTYEIQIRYTYGKIYGFNSYFRKEHKLKQWANSTSQEVRKRLEN